MTRVTPTARSWWFGRPCSRSRRSVQPTATTIAQIREELTKKGEGVRICAFTDGAPHYSIDTYSLWENGTDWRNNRILVEEAKKQSKGDFADPDLMNVRGSSSDLSLLAKNVILLMNHHYELVTDRGDLSGQCGDGFGDGATAQPEACPLAGQRLHRQAARWLEFQSNGRMGAAAERLFNLTDRCGHLAHLSHRSRKKEQNPEMGPKMPC